MVSAARLIIKANDFTPAIVRADFACGAVGLHHLVARFIHAYPICVLNRRIARADISDSAAITEHFLDPTTVAPRLPS